MRQSVKDYQRIVIKIGSSLLCPDNKNLDFDFVKNIIDQIHFLVEEKIRKEVILVSSGAIALGMSVIGLKSRPVSLPYLQAIAAIGQNKLMDTYHRFFKDLKMNCGQVLLTWDDFDNRRRYLNAKNTLLTLLKLKSLPIINENDTVSTDEIKFGDNDRLSALVATLISADLLLILSDVDGLLNKNKTLIRVVPEITKQIREFACPTDKPTCVGGMITKLEAAKIAVDSGMPCVVANGRSNNIIIRVVEDPFAMGTWTLFLPKKGHLAARKHWIAYSAKPKGKIMVDAGAKLALINKKSLLSVGVIDTEGSFEPGDIVNVIDEGKHEFARGKVRISSRQLEKVKGSHFDKEVIHCDNIVIL